MTIFFTPKIPFPIKIVNLFQKNNVVEVTAGKFRRSNNRPNRSAIVKAFNDDMNVLMIGNNPLELAIIFAYLKNIPGKKVITEIAFDLKSGLQRLSKFTPNLIIIDDNLGREELTQAVGSFSHFRKTKNTPVTVLKNSNYEEAFGGVAMNYILKEELSEQSLNAALRSSLISARAQSYLRKVYRKRKGQLKRLLPRI